jgi:hypothetical protein
VGSCRVQSFRFAIALRVSSQLRSAIERCGSECGFASKRSLKIPTNAKADLAIKIQAVANAFNRSPKTIRKWFNEGCNIFDPHEVMQWSQVKAKNSRSRNSHTAESLDLTLNGHRRDTAGMLNRSISASYALQSAASPPVSHNWSGLPVASQRQ